MKKIKCIVQSFLPILIWIAVTVALTRLFPTSSGLLILENGMLLVVYSFWCRKKGAGVFALPRLSLLPGIFLYGFGLQCISSAVVWGMDSSQQQSIQITPAMLIYAVLLAPCMEELLFRGLVCHFLSDGLQEKTVLFVQAILFACCHGSLLQGGTAFILGVGIGWLYLQTKQLDLAFGIHAVYNLSGILLSLLPQTSALWMAEYGTAMCFIFTAVLLLKRQLPLHR